MIYEPPSQNAIQKTLDAQLLSGITASMTLNNVTGIQNKPGVCVVDLIDANENFTPSKREYISFTGVSGSTLTGLTRNADGGGSDQDHAVGAIVQFPADVIQQQAIIDTFEVEHNLTDGKHTDALVTTLKASGAVVNTGTSDVTIVTPKALADSTLVFTNSLAYQCIINGGFTVNQRVYVSNATLAAGAYGHDRWKAGAGGGDYTFTQLAQSTQITIKSGKSLIQVVEDKNVIGGTYTLSWTGTAQARFGKDSATPSGSYAASPITITGQTAGTVMSVEFNEGTLKDVVLNSGSVALPFMPKSYEEELRACQRYYYKIGNDSVYNYYNVAFSNSTTAALCVINFPLKMRIAPTLETTGTATDYRILTPSSVICSAIPALLDVRLTNIDSYVVQFTVASGLTTGYSCMVGNNDTNAYLAFSAEL